MKLIIYRALSEDVSLSSIQDIAISAFILAIILSEICFMLLLKIQSANFSVIVIKANSYLLL